MKNETTGVEQSRVDEINKLNAGFDSVYHWVGVVRLMTWSVKHGHLTGRVALLANELRDGGELNIGLQVGSDDFMVYVYGSKNILWGIPCFDTSWGAAAVEQELEDLINELKMVCSHIQA